ncbi:ATP-binding protein [bacterium]|nr:MAG: ATP-binding protein [bacterium]
MTYARHLANTIQSHLATRKEAIVLTGPRQVGKTYLLNQLFPQATYFTLDDQQMRSLFDSYSLVAYRQIIPDQGTIILDEVQHLSDPGRAGKLIYDNFPKVHLIITGSAGLTIKNKHTESMAGRATSLELLPLTFSELLTQLEAPGETLNWRIWDHLTGNNQVQPSPIPVYDRAQMWERVLLYGMYPALVNHADPRQYLLDLTERIIFRDLLDLSLISDKKIALNLLILLAHQIGGLVSYEELATRLQIDARTVKHYLNVFEESYLIYRLYPYSLRQRNEVTKRPKIYFYDTGIRNSLIQSFSPLSLRDDVGQLFENFVVMEAVKAIQYQASTAKLNYWRTKAGSEIDLVIQTDGKLFGVECKWHQGRFNTAFKTRYPQAVIRTVTGDTVY